MGPAYYLAGYYLVEGASPAYVAPFLPRPLWSVSSCICPLYPDSAWGLSWATNPDEAAQMQPRLGLTDAQFATMQAWVDEAFNQGRLGWPHVWLDLAAAREFAQRYLAPIPNLKLLALALPAPDLEPLLAEFAPDAGCGAPGIYQGLQRRQPLTAIQNACGFAILGSNGGVTFHASLCHNLEVDYRDMLHLAFNEHGLLTTYEDARVAAAYTNLDSTGTEPGAWYPWLIVEMPLIAD